MTRWYDLVAIDDNLCTATGSGGELAGLPVLAIRERIPLAVLRELIYPYPTFVRGVGDALRQLS
jgi:hypothetical protein